MSDVRRQDEPSMEEILASIRRIIAEDGNAAGRGNAALREPEQDILDLTDSVTADGSVISLASRLPARDTPIYAPPPADYVVANDSAPAPAPAVERVSDRPTEKAEPKAEPQPERLISETTETASLAALAELAKSSRGRDGLPADADSEAAARELLKPMLKQWLDANLPALVERIVREEIARLTGAAK
jgi:hypothetical protein